MIAGRSHNTTFSRIFTGISLCLAVLFSLPLICRGGETTETIKTAYLYNFAKFTHWTDLPAQATLHFQIVGAHPFGMSLVPLNTKKIAGHPICIQTLQDFDPDQSSHILFLSKSCIDKVQDTLKSVAGKRILTVSDIPGFASAGGMIEIMEKGNNIRFRINIGATQASGIELSSQMLRLADSVIEPGKKP